MNITELLTTPDGAVLAAIGGEVALVTMRHETVNRVTIECFPLGVSTSVDAVLQLLGAHGFAGREPAIAVAVETPALPAPVQAAHACLDCGREFEKKQALSNHRSRKHGIAAVRATATPGDVACPDCPLTFVSKHALGAHRLRVHGIHGKRRRAPITGDHQCASCEARFETPMALDMHEMKVHRVPPPTAIVAAAVATPVTQPALEPPPPVSLDLPSVLESPVTSGRKKTRNPAMVVDGICPVCHEPLLTHEACDGCSILVGPGHETEHRVFISGADYCRDCARARIVARKAELVAA